MPTQAACVSDLSALAIPPYRRCVRDGKGDGDGRERALSIHRAPVRRRPPALDLRPPFPQVPRMAATCSRAIVVGAVRNRAGRPSARARGHRGGASRAPRGGSAAWMPRDPGRARLPADVTHGTRSRRVDSIVAVTWASPTSSSTPPASCAHPARRVGPREGPRHDRGERNRRRRGAKVVAPRLAAAGRGRSWRVRRSRATARRRGQPRVHRDESGDDKNLEAVRTPPLRTAGAARLSGSRAGRQSR